MAMNGSRKIWSTVAAIIVLLGGGTGTISLVGQQNQGTALETLRKDTLPTLQREMDQRDARIDVVQSRAHQNAIDVAAMRADISAIKEKTQQIDTIRDDVIELKVMQREMIRLLQQVTNHNGPAPSRDSTGSHKGG